jgi:hypothetical protein
MLNNAADKSLHVEVVSGPSDGNDDEARIKSIRIEQKILSNFKLSTLEEFFESVEDFILLARNDLRGRTGSASQQGKDTKRSICLSRGGRFFVSLASPFASSAKQDLLRDTGSTVTKKGASNRLLASFHSGNSDMHSEVD